MIRAVLDTNVLASGIGRRHPDAPAVQILDAWRAGRFELLISQDIFAEISRTLTKPYFRARISENEVERALSLFGTDAIWVSPTIDTHGAATHPEDDLILAAAASAKADYLVTGDAALLAIDTFQGVAIKTPRDFISILDSAGP